VCCFFRDEDTVGPKGKKEARDIAEDENITEKGMG